MRLCGDYGWVSGLCRSVEHHLLEGPGRAGYFAPRAAVPDVSDRTLAYLEVLGDISRVSAARNEGLVSHIPRRAGCVDLEDGDGRESRLGSELRHYCSEGE